MANPYDVLGINKTADQAEIKLAYRQLAKKYHPDLNNQDSEKIQIFQEINLAYEMLSNEQLRQKYDAGLIDEFGRIIQKKPEYQNKDTAPFDSKEFYEILKRELAKRKSEKSGFHASLKEYNFTLKLTLFESIKGCQKTLNIDGFKENFSISPGVVNGETVTFSRKEQGTEKNSKVKIKILVADHDVFTRDGNNIILNFPITLKEALSGGILEIPTVYDIFPIRIAPNIKSGTLVKLKGKGVLDPKNQQMGDQLTYIHISLPEQISPEFKTAIEMLEDKYPYNPRKNIFKYK